MHVLGTYPSPLNNNKEYPLDILVLSTYLCPPYNYGRYPLNIDVLSTYPCPSNNYRGYSLDIHVLFTYACPPKNNEGYPLDIQVYAPTSEAPDEDTEAFYHQLKETLSMILGKEIVLILSDFNAKVEETCLDDHARSAVGRFGIGVRNQRGERLLDFAIDNANTVYKHHIRHLYTWVSPGSRYRNQIDYALISSRWRSSLKDVKTYPGAFHARSWVMEDDMGEEVHEIEKVLDVWRRYCEKLYADPHRPLNQIEHPEAPPAAPIIVEPDIMREEVERAVSMLKKRKACGSDGITAETIQATGNLGIQVLWDTCRKIWQIQEWPKEWEESIFVPLHKKGSMRICRNYRLIALMSHASKIMLHILHSRIRSFLDYQIPQEPAGFVKGKGAAQEQGILTVMGWGGRPPGMYSLADPSQRLWKHHAECPG
ncbi:uncharacterized protein LOC105199275 [Solenopsis invicta]|uniref:uncharacterized protein LOC105199275 n=1 Tax=Solenopsis invicta TaxID=13686 RepID=UPI00193E029C|nr:uncharacterized protein LOC105199275 [Solenopsis invicta]